MATVNATCPCYVCGNACTDWNDVNCKPSDYFLNVCKDHNPSESCRENGHTKSTSEGQKILKMSIAYGQQPSNAPAITYPEIACTNCGRKNDVGNPKVNICWFCTNPVN